MFWFTNNDFILRIIVPHIKFYKEFILFFRPKNKLTLDLMLVQYNLRCASTDELKTIGLKEEPSILIFYNNIELTNKDRPS